MLFRKSFTTAPRPRRTLFHLECLEDRTVPTLLGQSLFPADNPWNQRIADAPVSAHSAAIINNIVNTYGNGRLHPDFGQNDRDSNDLYGIPFNIVHGNSTPGVNFLIDAYPDESDLWAAPIPTTVVLEGDYQNGPRFGVDNRGDSHLLVWDVDNNVAYEFYRASRPSENADNRWHADQQTVWDMKTNTFRTLGDTSADAAGLSILAGLVRPDEALPVEQGGQGVINHAIRFTLRSSLILNQFQYPASHTANPGNNNASNQPPMGARFRLKSSVDISQLYPQSRIVAQAMKDYGMILADNGSNFFFSGASSSVDANNQFTLTWSDDDIQDSTRGLKSLRYSDFEVVDLTPIVTSLDVRQGEAGATVTVTGQNFSGAAGRLQVWFGATPATSVTLVDDAHVRAVVPPGTGTVDVRVQSGVETSHPSNYTGAIFGYGTSVVTAAGRFEYGVNGEPPPVEPPTNQAPTVARAAKATPNVVKGTTSTLTVLGADDGGAAKLTYTWTVISKPNGALDPTFSANGSNAAKRTVVTFFQAGNYTFRATISDAGGLTVASDVTVSVQQKLKSLAIAPMAAQVVVLQSLQVAAQAFDQFGQALAVPPSFTWRLSGKGKLSSAGRYDAPAKPGGPYTITVAAKGLKASAKVMVIWPAVASE